MPSPKNWPLATFTCAQINTCNERSADMGSGPLAINQRIQSSHIPAYHRHMVIATNFCSLFDLLHCSITQTRAESCLEITVVNGHRTFPSLSGSALPPPLVPVRRAMQGHPQFPSIKR